MSTENSSQSAVLEAETQEGRKQEIESLLLHFIQEELLSPEVTVDREDDLLSGEILDSIAVVRLGAFVEEEFKIAIQPTDFVIENFQNVTVLAEYVCRATASGGQASTVSR